MQSRKLYAAILGSVVTGLIPVLAGIAVSFGMPVELAQHAQEILLWVIPALFGTHIVMTGAEDAAHKLGSPYPPSVPPEPTQERKGEAQSNVTFDHLGIHCLVPLMLLMAPLMGCTGPQDRMVERHLHTVVSDLRYRQAWETGKIQEEFEAFRVTKHAEITQAHENALRFMESAGSLDASAAKKAADKFGAMHYELDSRVALAVSIALKSAEWYGRAADTIDASVEYYQKKDQAAVEFAKAAIESFTQSYVASRKEASDPQGQQAQGVMDGIQAQLLGMLKARLGPPGTQ